MAVFFPVMRCEQVERSVGFLVLAAIKLALVLVLLVMFVHVLQKFFVAHLCFAFGNLRSCCSFAFEPSEYQILSGLYDFVFVLICSYEVFSTGHASLLVIFVKDGSAGAANRIEAILAVLRLEDHVHARTAYDQILVSYQVVLKRHWNLRL